MMDEISVIVPAYNAAAYLPQCLRALDGAGFHPNEIIVVDDGSTDDTVRIAADHGARVIRNVENLGAAGSRNKGAAETDANILFFVDADVLVHSDSRSVISSFFNDNQEFAAVFGTYDDDPTSPEAVSRARNLLHRYVHLESAGEIASFWTGCGAVRRTAFFDVGGFDDSLNMMEDVDLGLRLAEAGGRIMLLEIILDLRGSRLPFRIAQENTQRFIWADIGKGIENLERIIEETVSVINPAHALNGNEVIAENLFPEVFDFFDFREEPMPADIKAIALVVFGSGNTTDAITGLENDRACIQVRSSGDIIGRRKTGRTSADDYNILQGTASPGLKKQVLVVRRSTGI